MCVVDHDNNQIQEMGIDFSQLILRWGIDPGCWQFCSEGKNWIPCVLMYRFVQGCSMLILLGKETTAVQIRLTDGRWEAGRWQRAKQGNLFLLMCNNFPMSTGNHCQDVHCCFTEKRLQCQGFILFGIRLWVYMHSVESLGGCGHWPSGSGPGYHPQEVDKVGVGENHKNH